GLGRRPGAPAPARAGAAQVARGGVAGGAAGRRGGEVGGVPPGHRRGGVVRQLRGDAAKRPRLPGRRPRRGGGPPPGPHGPGGGAEGGGRTTPIAELRELSLTGRPDRENVIGWLADSPQLATLRCLTARGLWADGWVRLTASPHLASLKSLRLPSNNLGNAGI